MEEEGSSKQRLPAAKISVALLLPFSAFTIYARDRLLFAGKREKQSEDTPR